MPFEPSTVTLRGTWLYDGSVDAEVVVCVSPIGFGSGDHEDDPETANDRPATWFYVWWGTPGQPGEFKSGVGPFASMDAAAKYAEATAQSVRW
jgi:hypothetical protein